MPSCLTSVVTTESVLVWGLEELSTLRLKIAGSKTSSVPDVTSHNSSVIGRHGSVPTIEV